MQLKEGVNRSNRFLGSPAYLAPEIIMRQEHDPLKTDIWTLGIILFMLANGNQPFKGKDLESLKKNILRGFFAGQCFQKDLNQLINQLLERNHEDRPDIKKIKNSDWL